MITILRLVGPVISTRRSERLRHGRDRELLGRARELERAAGVELGLALLAGSQQLAASAVELVVEARQQLERVLREDLVVASGRAALNLDAHLSSMPGARAL